MGRRACIETPMGRRLICYADLTATGRYLHFVEAWIRRVRPYYANSHTRISSTGRIISELREEARRVVHCAVGAGPEDLVLFTGAGATAAISKLIGIIGLRIPEPLEREHSLQRHVPRDARPVVFIGPYEHHSNELPWVESIADVVEIGLDERGTIDLDDLERRLQQHDSRPFKIGSFSAASNVTGVLSDVGAIAKRLHEHDAWALFDYAAAGPYVPIRMHPDEPGAHIDALFLSMHKFVGGPEASGVLVANRRLFRTRIPERPGGGTVEYVVAAEHDAIDYVQRLDEREEGGTPAIIGDLRAGTAFLVKELVGVSAIFEHEVELARATLARLSRAPRIRVLGPIDVARLSIVSFNIDGLHHDLVAVLLDHLFGIQNRAGCSCAGPYGHRLLGLDRSASERLRALVRRGVGGIKPGWVRLTIPYYASPEDVEFILAAVEFIAEHGEVFVPLYQLGWKDGVWRHRERPVPDVPPIELTVEALEEAAQSFAAGDHEAPMSERQLQAYRASYFAEAHALVTDLRERWRLQPPRWNPPTGHHDVDEQVWFRYVDADELSLDEGELVTLP